jgi:putative ABC transport system ATP-binding protein
MFKIKNLCKSFFTTNNEQVVLDSVSLSIMRQSFTAISGPSGSGKSTLLSILSGLEKSNSGSIIYNDFELTALNQTQLATLRNQEFGFIFQSPFYIPYKSLIENILLPISYMPHDKDKKNKIIQATEWAYHLADLVGLSNHLSKSPSLLSGGEQQRMAFARALILKPKVIFADEPSASLDHKNADILLSLLKSETAIGKTVILVSHDKQAISVADTVFELDKAGKDIVKV